jgi:hypothetical protein
MIMTGFFSPTAAGARDAVLADYLRFLDARNGTLDPAVAYPKRERWLAQANAATVRHAGQLAAATFSHAWERFDGGTARDHVMTTLLAFLKMNAGEAYGVETLGRARHTRPSDGSLLDTVERVLIREESYHTRILSGAVHQFDLPEPTAAYRPPLPIKLLIGTLVHVPGGLFHPVLLAAEVAGLFTFNWVLQRVGEVFAPEPALRDLLEERLVEIITDEIGHVAFNRLAVGDAGLWAARQLAPHVSHATARATPELLALGWTRDDLTSFASFDLERLPEASRRKAFYA